MSKVFYSKLIRDFIPKKILGNGEECEVRTIDDAEEFEQELLKKVAEEAGALLRTRSRNEFLEEYADLMVVLDSLTAHYEFSEADIKDALGRNIEKKGLFKEKFFLHWSSKGKYQSNETPQGLQ